jgi:hypothetical protein
MEQTVNQHEAFVYRWLDSRTGMLYVGVHKGAPGDGYICSSKPMLQEYHKRPSDFSREVLKFGPYRDMHKLEQSMLESVNAPKNPSYYNQSAAQGPFYCTSHTPETKAKMSISAKKRGITLETRAKITESKRGQSPSKETRDKISATKKGRPFSPEHRINISVAAKKRGITAETRAKINFSNKQRKLR